MNVDDLVGSPSERELPDRAAEYRNPDKTLFWSDSGVDLVLDRREGCLIRDMGGRRLIDAHLSGGTDNLGHRNREVMGGAGPAAADSAVRAGRGAR